QAEKKIGAGRRITCVVSTFRHRVVRYVAGSADHLQLGVALLPELERLLAGEGNDRAGVQAHFELLYAFLYGLCQDQGFFLARHVYMALFYVSEWFRSFVPSCRYGGSPRFVPFGERPPGAHSLPFFAEPHNVSHKLTGVHALEMPFRSN